MLKTELYYTSDALYAYLLLNLSIYLSISIYNIKAIVLLPLKKLHNPLYFDVCTIECRSTFLHLRFDLVCAIEDPDFTGRKSSLMIQM